MPMEIPFVQPTREAILNQRAYAIIRRLTEIELKSEMQDEYEKLFEEKRAIDRELREIEQRGSL